MRLNRSWIESRIPHHGRMCLLDEVIAWSAARVSCRSNTHREADHPLRAYGRLGIACGIEYAAPPAPAPPSAGFLAAVRDVRFHSLRLDDVRGDLICDAVRMAGDATTAVYEFELRSEAALLLRGRATVVFDAGLAFASPGRSDE